jgi:Zn-dependent peptidase ImmA (M78 family)
LTVSDTVKGAGIMPDKVSFYDEIFGFIKKNIDGLLSYDENICYSENPVVDIVAIAKNAGIADVLPVPQESIPNKHALLVKSIEKNVGIFIILVNKEISREEQRFSIAHEIEHFISLKNISIAHEIAHIWESDKKAPYQAVNLPRKAIIAARRAYLPQLKTLEKNEETVAEKITEIVSLIIGKNISEEKTDAIFREYANGYTHTEDLFQAGLDTIVEIVEEEIADYFAANLLVPTERFILWEDKTDEEIARAFEVPVQCVKKRREEEIEFELAFLAPKNLSSGVRIEGTALLTHDELDHILEGYTTHDTGRG